MRDTTHPPSNLPPHVEAMLVSALKQDLLFIRAYIEWPWVVVQHRYVLPFGGSSALMALVAFGDLCPPTQVCLTTGCPNHCSCSNVTTLSNPVTYKAVWYSLQYSVVPIHVTSTYCCRCLHQYHHNYVVRKVDDAHVYYGGVPEVIQVATHFFIDNQVLEMFATAKVFGW
ncbi:hypothetical protein PAXRUDRAFT_181164 [Paxillus rubicundulus Ve08.2h10]|uniref:CxC5 like cysteine cluster associated with KDZ domain-containing protein n=1 Tax=Paxillus rubicundulus Ve08.2h10 TaxID=930991 RepID=A0A0D0CND6_9AGAM|nr:hypothetical protein PAXRUDRAFT_181164 [Paxillus rubicundulus Ve08.2h10]